MPTLEVSVEVPTPVIGIANRLLDLAEEFPQFTVLHSFFRVGTEDWNIETELQITPRAMVAYARTNGIPGRVKLGERRISSENRTPAPDKGLTALYGRNVYEDTNGELREF